VQRCQHTKRKGDRYGIRRVACDFSHVHRIPYQSCCADRPAGGDYGNFAVEQ